ncbi:tyrosine-type recombinase/integrase [Novosphingobium decolorationis]|uniref:Integrase arm-type DNA-binding domain-containing protein n=1 Tax=Novosphingobium decolorationis TaxID=2698673 RepID=A0ABX8E9J0_9SPHN|nr:integrase arm-type DNA-binding domain-containing protein [Novosphingobium decolorationis]QVM85249.1 integrase arm-type DNA-binding domain-containing protein [Novosphingobium decolorationis]
MPLTNTTIKNARPRTKDWKLFDEKGLYLLVKTTGAKLWRMKFRHHGVERKLSFGPWPDVSLKKARELRDEARATLQDGLDPSRERKKAKSAARREARHTFAVLADEFLDKRQADGLADTTISKKNWLLNHLKSAIGSAPVNDISVPELLTAIQQVEAKDKRETARRLRSIAGEVFSYAIATGRAQTNPATQLRGALRTPQVTHIPAIIDVGQVADLMRAIDRCTGYPSTLAALRISPHLFQRPGEIRQMRWADLKLDDAQWVPRIDDLKMRKPHQVPLSTQALAIIEEMAALRNGPYVFPAFNSGERPISENTLNGALKRLGYGGKMTAHGFRTMASSLLNESGKWNPDAIERALSHKVGNTVSATYNRTLYWKERVEMMQWWSDWLDDLKAGKV